MQGIKVPVAETTSLESEVLDECDRRVDTEPVCQQQQQVLECVVEGRRSGNG